MQSEAVEPQPGVGNYYPRPMGPQSPEVNGGIPNKTCLSCSFGAKVVWLKLATRVKVEIDPMFQYTDVQRTRNIPNVSGESLHGAAQPGGTRDHFSAHELDLSSFTRHVTRTRGVTCGRRDPTRTRQQSLDTEQRVRLTVT